MNSSASAVAWCERLGSAAASAPASGIAEVMRHGFGRNGIIPLWVGEGDEPTPAFICETAAESMARGETFYMPQPGIQQLRDGLAAYHDRLYGGLFGEPFPADRFYVTGSGMQAIQIAIRLVADPGDEVIVPTPAWPNFPAAVGVAGAKACQVPLRFDPAGWRLDLDDIAAAIGPRTKALFINSPSNPTGWTATEADLAAIVELCRRRDLWIIADEVYSRFTYGSDRPTTPSLHDHIVPDDRVLFVNTFSKNWAMTGWRVGWIEAPEAIGPAIENLIQYATSGVAVFMQRAAARALSEGESALSSLIDRARIGRDIVSTALAAIPGVSFAPPGGFYLFFRVDGVSNSTEFAATLIKEADVGLAPGSAFGAGGEGFFRLCFARNPDDLSEACARFANWMSRRA
ncbi:pyridoxal phosphate-dependent aminotransferase [Mesorhizobium sp. BAC0120]|uniref:pyridoxal phosphate-dependent aminotransferase n=1 Tax=Mesorhizobium sp. BAC0120 TaxID=3090670 RepID=UPI00298C3683|nr:pyridoxal phosphate-dependent aminotransferase [Mesorhizobium sp. BAC0120]MDW6023025.1 pyridoxal phosphate-dependent aminotransferase [Mesorhizobium sp. BAC0120]